MLFLCWIDQQGRSEELAQRLGAELHLISSKITRRVASAPLRYVDQTIATLRVLARRRPAALIVMQPPIPLLAIAFVVAKLRRSRLVVDFHHDPFEEPRWRWSLGPSLWIARHADLSVVTNAAHAAILAERGARALVLHDAPQIVGEERLASGGDHVLVPFSYSPDEPYEAILAAAAQMGERRFLITGRVPPGQRMVPPPNVTLTGFVGDAEYACLMASAAAVLCLTRNQNTMQRGGYEARAWHVPLVTSDRAVLRDYFGDAAAYCDPDDPAAIATALGVALDPAAGQRARMAALDARVIRDYEGALAPLRAAIS